MTCVCVRVNIQNPSPQRKRSLWMEIRRDLIGVFEAVSSVMLQKKDITWRRRRKNVFLYIIIGPHLLNKTEICLYIVYIYIYITYKGRVFFVLSRCRFGRDFIVHRIFNNDTWKWPIHDRYMLLCALQCAHIINPDHIYIYILCAYSISRVWSHGQYMVDMCYTLCVIYIYNIEYTYDRQYV
jgi:hypothetical protein